MADSLGASYFVFNPGLLAQAFSYQGVVHASRTSADNTDTVGIVINQHPTAGIHILFLHATYEAAADAGNLNVTGANASIRDQSPVVALVAGTTKIVQLPNPLSFLQGDGNVTIILKAGGSLTGTVSAMWVYGFGQAK